MQDFVINVAAVALVLGVMILVHEFGHYAAAKLFGVRVEVFSIGFGKRLLGFKKGDTDYRISAIPLGGYVKMSGENFSEERSGAEYEFMSHPRWQRLVIAFAGPFMNIVLAIGLLTGVFMVRYEHPVILDEPAVIGWVSKGSPAAKADLQPGDRIVRIDGVQNPTWEDVNLQAEVNGKQPLQLVIDRNGQNLTRTVLPEMQNGAQSPTIGWAPNRPSIITGLDPSVPIAEKAGIKVGDVVTSVGGQPTTTWAAMVEALQDNKNKPVTLDVKRGTSNLSFTVTPELTKLPSGQNWYRIGIASEPTRIDKLPFTQALSKSIEQNKKFSLLILELVEKMLQRKVSVTQMSGPIGIAQASGEAARQQGWTPLLALMSAISLNLAIFNLFPIPILDGGMILMLLVESVRRRDISLVVKERIYQVAYVLLILFAVMVIYNDLTKVIPGLQRLP
jgi:regulator of sigma E protease